MDKNEHSPSSPLDAMVMPGFLYMGKFQQLFNSIKGQFSFRFFSFKISGITIVTKKIIIWNFFFCFFTAVFFPQLIKANPINTVEKGFKKDFGIFMFNEGIFDNQIGGIFKPIIIGFSFFEKPYFFGKGGTENRFGFIKFLDINQIPKFIKRHLNGFFSRISIQKPSNDCCDKSNGGANNETFWDRQGGYLLGGLFGIIIFYLIHLIFLRHNVHAHRRAANVNSPNFKFKNSPFYRAKSQRGEVLCSMLLCMVFYEIQKWPIEIKLHLLSFFKQR